jgi:hypothetical protein
VIKAYAEAKMWAKLGKFIIMLKKCPVPFPFVAEICLSHENMELVKDSLIKGVLENDVRIDLMIEFKLWVLACEEIYKHNLQEDYLDELRAKAPSWIM